MAQSPAPDAMHPTGKLPPTLTPTGHFAGKPTLPISRSVTQIGSHKHCRLQLLSSTVSQNHALLVNADSGPYIRDLASREHVSVNGIEVKEGDLSDGDEIQIGRFTFRFNASAQTAPAEEIRRIQPAPLGRLQMDGEAGGLPLQGRSVLIGRRDTCDIVLPHDSVSTTHAIVFEMDGRRYVRDLHSRTGTRVNGEAIHQVELSPGDEITIGGATLRYLEEEGAVEEAFAPAVPMSDLAFDEPTPAEPEALPVEGEGDIGIEAEAPIHIEAEADTPLDVEADAAAPLEVEGFEVEEPTELEALEAAAQAPSGLSEPAQTERNDPTPSMAGEFDLSPTDLEPAKGSGEAHPGASLGELTAEHLDLDDEAVQEVSVDDLLGEAAMPVDDADRGPADRAEAEAPPGASLEVEPARSPEEERARFQGQGPAASLHTGPALSVDLGVSDIGGAVDLGRVDLGGPLELADEADALTPDELPESQYAPGASQLDLPPAEDEAREAAAPHAESELRVTPDDLAPDDSAVAELTAEHGAAAASDAAPAAPAEPAPAEIALDQEALEAEQAAAAERDLAPDESFDTIESRQAGELDFGAAADEGAVELEARAFELAPHEGDAGGSREAEAPTLEPTELESADAEAPAEAPVAEESVAADEDAVHVEATAEGAAGEVAERGDLADTIVGDQTPVFEIEDAVTEQESPAEPAGLAGEPQAIEATEAPAAEPGIAGAAGAVVGAIAGAVAGAAEAAAGAAPQTPRKQKPRRKSKKANQEAAVEESVEPPPLAEVIEQPSAHEAAEPPIAFEPVAEAPQADDEDSSAGVEVLEHTDATPESAQVLGESDAAAAGEPPGEMREVELTDTGFGRAVEALSAGSAPIVEEREAQPPAEETVETPLAVDDAAALDLLNERPTAGTEEPVELTAEEAEEPAVLAAEAPEPLFEAEPVDATKDEKLFELSGMPPATEEQPAESIEPLDIEAVVEEPPRDLKELEIAAAPDAPPSEEPVDAAGGGEDTLGEWGLELEPEEPPAAVELEQVGDEVAASQAAVGEAGLSEESDEPPPSRYAPGSSRLDLEPLEAGQPADIGAPVNEDDLALEALAEAPGAGDRVEPPAPTVPPRGAPPAGGVPFNWGANQEHFLGGMPLQLGGGATQSTPGRPIPRAPLTPPPAARRPLTDDAITPIGPVISDEPLTPVLPQPPSSARPGGRRGGFGAQPSPFAGADARNKPVTTGFDGLAMPPVREADVFAPMPGSLTGGFSPGLSDDVFGGNARRSTPPQTMPPPTPQPQPRSGMGAGAIPPSGATPAAEPSRRPQTRRATKAEPPGESWTPGGSPALQAPEPDGGVPLPSPAQEHRPPAGPRVSAGEPPRKKRRWFGLRLFLMLLALPAAVGAAGAAYALAPNRSTVRGELKFVNFDQLPQRDRGELAQQQQKLLGDESVRSSARNKLSNLDPKLGPGFLAGGVELAKLRTEAKMDMDSGTFVIPFTGGAARADQDRMFALLQAMFDANGERRREAEKLDSTLQTLVRERAESERTLADYKRRIDQLGTIAQSGPDAAERATLEGEVKKLEAAWNEADLAASKIAGELKDLQANAAAKAPGGDAQEAGPIARITGEIDKFQGELQQLNDRIAAIQKARSSGGVDGVRKRFTDAVGDFDSLLVKAVAAAKEGSPFQAYLDHAKGVIDRAQQQGDASIKRLEELYARLAENSASLNEKQNARRAEVARRDPELVTLMDQKEIKTRQYNAAVSEGLSAEAAEIKTELNLLDSMIMARQTKAADDDFLADSIDQLERIADGTRKQIADEREQAAQGLDDLSAALARSRPKELSPQQQDLAAGLEQALGAVGAAQQQFADAIASANREADDQLKLLQAEAVEVQGTLQALKAELADAKKELADAEATPSGDAAADRKQQIEAKSAELAAAQKQRDDARAAYQAANAQLVKQEELVKRARAAGEERDRLIAQHDAERADLNQKNLHYEARKKESTALAYPEIPQASHVIAELQPDQRPMFALIAGGGVAALFVLGIMLTGGRRESRAMEAEPPAFDDEHAGAELPQLDSSAEHRGRARPVEV